MFKTANTDNISRPNSRPKLHFPGNGKGKLKMPREGKGREIWGLYSRESRETGIPAHPWLEVPFLSAQIWTLLPKVPKIGWWKMALPVPDRKFWDHFYKPNIPQKWWISHQKLNFIIFRVSWDKFHLWAFWAIFGPILEGEKAKT